MNNSTYDCLNDPAANPEARLTSLASQAASICTQAVTAGASNNHIHTIYSFSPYTPAMAAAKARQALLEVAGSVDHDSIAAAEEMTRACALLHMGCVTGCEIRVRLTHSKAGKPYSFASRKINSPDAPGLAYMTIQGVSVSGRPALDAFLAPLRKARLERTMRMAQSANKVLESMQLPPLDAEKDIVGASQFAQGGTVTERHLLAAVARIMLSSFGSTLVKSLAALCDINVPPHLAASFESIDNNYILYDLLGLLKSEFLPCIFIAPGKDECPEASAAVTLALTLGAVPAYAYLGDVAESITGDKKAEKFEDDFLPELMEAIIETGFPALTYMPPRNTPAQIARIQSMCKDFNLMEISGVDINGPRQRFDCPELLQKNCAHLSQSAWALVAHEALASVDSHLGLFNPASPYAHLELGRRIAIFAHMGHEIVSLEGKDLERFVARFDSTHLI